MAQLVKHPTLDFSSGHDLTVHAFEPHVRLPAVSAEPALDPVSLSLCPSPAHARSLFLSVSQKQNKKIHMHCIFIYIFLGAGDKMMNKS